MASVDTSQPTRLLRTLEAVVVVVAALYFGRPLLVPLALALLLTFLLTPAVSALQHRGLPRVPAVGLVVVLIAFVSAFLAWKTVGQLSDLVLNLPTYRENLHVKVQSFRGAGSGPLHALERTVSVVTDEFEDTSSKAKRAANKGAPDAAESPLPVRVVSAPVNPFTAMQVTILALAEPLVQTGLVTVLVIFMLCAREDVRNRFVRLAGTGRITLTTRTLDELGTRISKYLVMNALVNGGFGVVIGLGLFALGVNYAVLWGCLAAVLRFVPYLGAIVAAVLPLGMAVIQFPTWTQPLLAATLFVVVELVTNNVIEPLTYGRSGGVSTVALLLAAIFWSWIWGPIGLMLSVPLTVLLAVLGKYVPPLEPLWILLGDDPPLPPHVQLYQRLLAGDSEEAAEVVEEFAHSQTPLRVFDELLVPSLVMAERDRGRGEITEAMQQFIWTTMQQLLDEATGLIEPEAEVSANAPDTRRVLVIGVPAADRSDELALEMLGRVIPSHVDLEMVPQTTLVSELIERLAEAPPQLVCISALGPGGVGQIRYLCKRIRQRFSDVKILVGRWGYQGDAEKLVSGLQARGASQVVTSLGDAVEVIRRVQSIAPPAPTAVFLKQNELAREASTVKN
jgi:predicted PurR-regulated permease PerM